MVEPFSSVDRSLAFAVEKYGLHNITLKIVSTAKVASKYWENCLISFPKVQSAWTLFERALITVEVERINFK